MYYGKCSSQNLKLIPPFIVNQMSLQYMKHLSFSSHPKIKVSSLWLPGASKAQQALQHFALFFSFDTFIFELQISSDVPAKETLELISQHTANPNPHRKPLKQTEKYPRITFLWQELSMVLTSFLVFLIIFKLSINLQTE